MGSITEENLLPIRVLGLRENSEVGRALRGGGVIEAVVYECLFSQCQVLLGIEHIHAMAERAPALVDVGGGDQFSIRVFPPSRGDEYYPIRAPAAIDRRCVGVL